jgi:hypothetical protein
MKHDSFHGVYLPRSSALKRLGKAQAKTVHGKALRRSLTAWS